MPVHLCPLCPMLCVVKVSRAAHFTFVHHIALQFSRWTISGVRVAGHLVPQVSNARQNWWFSAVHRIIALLSWKTVQIHTWQDYDNIKRRTDLPHPQIFFLSLHIHYCCFNAEGKCVRSLWEGGEQPVIIAVLDIGAERGPNGDRNRIGNIHMEWIMVRTVIEQLWRIVL